MPTPHWPSAARLRPTSIRAKVVVLLTVPVVSLMALWGYATVSTASRVSAADQLRSVDAQLITPIRNFTTAVQNERTAAQIYRAAPSTARQLALKKAESATDTAAGALRSGVGASSTDIAALDSALPGRIDAMLGAASALTSGSADADGSASRITRGLAAGYGNAVAQALSVQAGLADADTADHAGGARAVLELARARESLSEQDAVVQAAQASGTLGGDQFLAFVRATGAQQSLTAAAVPDLPQSDAAAFRAVLGSPAATALGRAQQAIAAAGPDHALSAVPGSTWTAAAGPVLTGLTRAEAAAEAAGAGTDPYSLSVLGGSGLAVVLGLVGVVLSLVLSVRIGRGLVTDLTGLRNDALRLASTRLPSAIRRIHNGEQVDIDAEAPPEPEGAGHSEIGQVAAALTTVHRAALRAVAGRAAVLTGVSGVYVGLARRSQVLLHKQLDLLDTMERRTEDPVELEDLFRLDHLTTRMRRHAESLLILSGSAPGRGWRKPVPLLDAVRAGAAETVDLSRVQILSIPDLWLEGGAVADLVHLIAELTENAEAFSPPNTRVTVRGDEVGRGTVLEIEDRGLGMSDAALAAANERINAPEVDLLDSRQLGLFVVNRLAQRLKVRVSLRHSVYGGVCAVVFIPKELLRAPSGPRPLETAGGGALAAVPTARRDERETVLPRYARHGQGRPVELLRVPEPRDPWGEDAPATTAADAPAQAGRLTPAADAPNPAAPAAGWRNAPGQAADGEADATSPAGPYADGRATTGSSADGRSVNGPSAAGRSAAGQIAAVAAGPSADGRRVPGPSGDWQAAAGTYADPQATAGLSAVGPSADGRGAGERSPAGQDAAGPFEGGRISGGRASGAQAASAVGGGRFPGEPAATGRIAGAPAAAGQVPGPHAAADALNAGAGVDVHAAAGPGTAGRGSTGRHAAPGGARAWGGSIAAGAVTAPTGLAGPVAPGAPGASRAVGGPAGRAASPGGPASPSAQAPAARRAAAQASAPQGPAAPAPPAQDIGGLPRRVKQASLAPELRRDGGAEQGGGPRTGNPRPSRSPEAARATMTSLRSGRRRARAAGATTAFGPGAAGEPTGGGDGSQIVNQQRRANQSEEAGPR